MGYYQKRIDEVFRDSIVVDGNKHPKIAFFSDCHRGNGTWNDSFLNNKTLYQAALNYYRQRDYTYIEIGDGDELWENRCVQQIHEVHGDVFTQLNGFYRSGRLFMLWGNHDRAKARKTRCTSDSLFDPSYHESLIIKMPHPSQDLYLLHGHQADIFNDRLWPLARWMVRYLWKPLELAGFKNPTSAARNYKKRKVVEGRLARWAETNHKNLMAGHTHRPAMPAEKNTGYFNSGSCVHPNGITCIELNKGMISLIKWTTCVNSDNMLYVCRQILSGPRAL